VAQFNYLWKTVTDQKFIEEKIERKHNSGNIHYRSVQIFLSSRLLCKNVEIILCETIILPVVLYWCETCSLTLREKYRLRVFEDRMLRIFGSRRDEVIGVWRNQHNEELHHLYSSPSRSQPRGFSYLISTELTRAWSTALIIIPWSFWVRNLYLLFELAHEYLGAKGMLIFVEKVLRYFPYGLALDHPPNSVVEMNSHMRTLITGERWFASES
jgi:hypothetical protein